MFALLRQMLCWEEKQARLNGVCVKCDTKFTPSLNKVRNPLTGEEKVSALCKECRKKVMEDMMARLDQRKHAQGAT